MRQTIKQYVQNCHVCKRAKTARDIYNGLLQPLPVPERLWVNVTMDFVTGLPKCHAYGQIFNAISMVINRLSKERHYIPCTEENKGTSAEAIAELVMRHVWSRKDLPISMTSDRGHQFVAKMWDSLCKLLGIKAKLSTAWHSETDGQSKITNQEIRTIPAKLCQSFSGQLDTPLADSWIRRQCQYFYVDKNSSFSC